MFILGFITVSALMVWLVVVALSKFFSRQPEQEGTALVSLISPVTWLWLGFVFILGSLGNIGLYCWSKSYRK